MQQGQRTMFVHTNHEDVTESPTDHNGDTIIACTSHQGHNITK